MMKRLARLIYTVPLFVAVLACNLIEPPTPTFLPPLTNTPAPPTQAGSPTPAPATPKPATPEPAQPTVIPTGAPVGYAQLAPYLAQVDLDRLLISVESLQNFGTRFVLAGPASRTEGIGGAAHWLIDQFRQIEEDARANGVPFVVQPHTFTLDWRGTSTTQTNVVAYLPGSGARLNEVIVVGAHYDSISETAEAGAPAPGADDNGSGVAVMLECARILAQEQHAATVVFVAFAAEETGMQGSQAFLADVVAADNLDVRAMINLDIVGAQTMPDGQSIGDRVRVFSAPPNDSPSRHLARLVHYAAALYLPDFSVELQDAIDREGRWGDQIPFVEAGYAAVRLIEAAEAPDRTNSSRDTMDRIAAGYMARVTRAALAALVILADGPTPPAAVNRAGGALTWAPSPNAVGYVVALRHADGLAYDRWIEAGPDGTYPTGGEQFTGMTHAAIAAIDAQGRHGPFGAEVSLGP